MFRFGHPDLMQISRFNAELCLEAKHRCHQSRHLFDNAAIQLCPLYPNILDQGPDLTSKTNHQPRPPQSTLLAHILHITVTCDGDATDPKTIAGVDMKNRTSRQIETVIGGFLISVVTISLGCGRPTASTNKSATQSAPRITDGIWAKQMVLASQSSAAGIKSDSKIERILLAKVTFKDGYLQTTEQLCDIKSTASKSTSLSFPDAFKKSIPSREVHFKINFDGNKTQLVSDQNYEVIGAKLARPESDPLPTKADDAAIVDQDGDQKPGATVEVSAHALFVNLSGHIYLTQRTELQESGIVKAPDQIEGSIAWKIEQHSLGSDSTVLGSVSPTITPQLELSKFVMRKVSDSSNCEQIIANHDQLFGPLID